MEEHLADLSGRLARELRVRVVVSAEGWRTVHEVVEGVPVTRLGRAFALRSTSFCPGMPRAIRNSGADLVHLHLPNPAASAAYLASGHPGPLVVTYHSDIVRQRVLGRLVAPLTGRILDRAAAIVVASEATARHSPVLAHRLAQCRFIPFGIDRAPLEAVDPARVAGVRARFGPRIVLGVGRMVYYKGFEYLIEAMRDVPGRLLLVGEGPQRAELAARARALGVADRVELLGSVDDVAPFYHAADVFALPSVERSEAFGLVQLEAMACGTPVVNTWLDTAVPTVSLDGVTGRTVPPRDAQALGAALRELLDDDATRARFGDAARRRVREVYDLDRMAAETAAVYRAALAEGARTR
jgi:rhamnosyl/mannosyltransferase